MTTRNTEQLDEILALQLEIEMGYLREGETLDIPPSILSSRRLLLPWLKEQRDRLLARNAQDELLTAEDCDRLMKTEPLINPNLG